VDQQTVKKADYQSFFLKQIIGTNISHCIDTYSVQAPRHSNKIRNKAGEVSERKGRFPKMANHSFYNWRFYGGA
jgi:hypothetical protein